MSGGAAATCTRRRACPPCGRSPSRLQVPGSVAALVPGWIPAVTTEEGELEAKIQTLMFHLGGASPQQQERRGESEVGKNANDVGLC